MHIYLSFSRVDAPIIENVASALRSHGHDVAFNFDDLRPGQDFSSVIRGAIESSEAVIVFWSPRSIGSEWVMAEALRAIERNVLISVSIAGAQPPTPFDTYHHLKLEDSEGLLAALSRLEDRSVMRGVPTRQSRQLQNEPEIPPFFRRPLPSEAPPPPWPPTWPDEQQAPAAAPAPPEPFPDRDRLPAGVVLGRSKPAGSRRPSAATNAVSPTGGTPDAELQPARKSNAVNVFISYSRNDRAACRQLFELLIQKGLNPWYDAELEAGNFKNAIAGLIGGAKVFVILLSKNSIASNNVRKELTLAANGGPVIVPISIDETEVKDLKGAFAYELAELNIFQADPAQIEQWTRVIDTIEKATQQIEQIEAHPLLQRDAVPASFRAPLELPHLVPLVADDGPLQRSSRVWLWLLMAMIVGVQLASIGFLIHRSGYDLAWSTAATGCASIILLPMVAATGVLFRKLFSEA